MSNVQALPVGLPHGEATILSAIESAAVLHETGFMAVSHRGAGSVFGFLHASPVVSVALFGEARQADLPFELSLMWRPHAQVRTIEFVDLYLRRTAHVMGFSHETLLQELEKSDRSCPFVGLLDGKLGTRRTGSRAWQAFFGRVIELTARLPTESLKREFGENVVEGFVSCLRACAIDGLDILY